MGVPGISLILAAVLAAWASGSPLKGMYVAIHVVRRGETAASLVRTFGTTRGTLESLNQSLDLGLLKPGDRVRILSRPGVFQKLQYGLTVSDVALAYQVDRNDLLEVNGITNPRRIQAGCCWNSSISWLFLSCGSQADRMPCRIRVQTS